MRKKWDVIAECHGCHRISTNKVTPIKPIEAGQELGMGGKGTCPGCEWGSGFDIGTILGSAPVGIMAIWNEKKVDIMGV